MPEIPSYAMSAVIASQGRKADAIARLKARNARTASPKAKPEPATVNGKASLSWSPEIAASAGAKAATQRALDVAGSPHFEANRTLAIKLLGNDKLSGAEIVAMLDLTGAKDRAGQDAALEDMRAALAEAGAQNAGPAPAAVGTARSQAIWDRAIASVAAQKEAEGGAA